MSRVRLLLGLALLLLTAPFRLLAPARGRGAGRTRAPASGESALTRLRLACGLGIVLLLRAPRTLLAWLRAAFGAVATVLAAGPRRLLRTVRGRARSLSSRRSRRDAAAPAGERTEHKPPVWKRDLFAGRRVKAAAAGEEPSSKPAGRRRGLALRRRRERPAQEAAAAAPAQQPFWKRDLFGGRKRKGAAVAAPPPPERQEQKTERKPRLRLPRVRAGSPATAKSSAGASARAGAGLRMAARRISQVLTRLPRLRAKPSVPGLPGKRTALVGLKIGASQVAAAHVVNNGSPELVQTARASLAGGVVVGGELRDPDTLADALKELFAAHKLPRRGVRLGLATNRIGVRTFDISGIADPKQLDNAIRFRAQEALPIPIEEAVLDYHMLEERVDEQGAKTHRVLLVVAYRELVDGYARACRKAGLKLAGIDLEAFALLRALVPPAGEPETGAAPGAAVVVSIGHERSTIAISHDGICESARVLDWGGATLDAAIAGALDVEPAEAEQIKRSLSLSDAETLPEGLAPEQGAMARQAIRAELQSFARELVSSLQAYQSQPGSRGIGEIVVTGGTTQLPGLDAELERLIGVAVRIGDPLAAVKLRKPVEEGTALGSLAVAIGLGIER